MTGTRTSLRTSNSEAVVELDVRDAVIELNRGEAGWVHASPSVLKGCVTQTCRQST